MLEGCKDHPNGCYIRFRELKKNATGDEKVYRTEGRNDVIVDRDKDNNIIGIEFYEGL